MSWESSVREIFSILDSKVNSTFIRIVIFDDYIDLFHIDAKIISKKTRVYFEKKEEALSYIRLNKRIPIELVISNKSMSCKAISRKSVSYKEIRELADNMLSLKKESVNAVFYDDAVPKNNFVMICASKLEKAIVDFINDILLERNQVTFIAWPVWIVSTHFQNFPSDREKFHCALFSIEREEICEIIAYTSNGIICYRNGDIKRRERETEIENTIKYIKKTHGILPEDVVIYSIDDSVIENLLKRSTNNMGIICNNIDTSLLKYKNHINKIIKIAFSLFSLFFICKCCFGILDIFDLNKQIAACNSVINSLDKEVLSELSLWNDIDCSFINYPNFKDLLRQKIKTDRIGKIQNATIAFNEESKEILTKLIPLEN